MVKISVILLIKDGEEYIRYLYEYFSRMENKYKLYYEFEYFIYENNSKDNTRDEIKKFYENMNGFYWCENIDKNKDLQGISKIRGNYMKFLRNKLKTYHGKLDSDFCLLLDCDVVLPGDLIPRMFNSFNEGLIYVGKSEYDTKSIDIDTKLINSVYNDYFFTVIKDDKCIIKKIDKNYENDENVGWEDERYINSKLKDVVMVSVFDVDYKKREKNHYYDTLALITKEGIDYSKTYNKCLFKKCIMCNNHRKQSYKKRYLKEIDEHLLDDKESVRVNSVFGGCCMIKTEVYNKVEWYGEYECEHIGFCELVRKYGNIIINPSIKVFTTQPEFRNYTQIQNDLFDK